MRLRRSHTLLVLLRGRGAGPVLAVETVTARDLEDCLAEAWFEACLRRGAPGVAFDELEAELHPLRSSADGHACLGFGLEARGTTTVFSSLAVEPVARRAELGLRASGRLPDAEEVFFELAAVPVEATERTAEAVARPGRATSLELQIRELPAELRSAAAEDDYPVLYTPAARARAERIARQGAAASPPVETGGLLVGPLCLCPRTGEVFALIEDVVPALDAEEEERSLTFSGRTWQRIEAAMSARRADPATRHQRILGQTHGHSFLPQEGELDTAFLSADDLRFCRAAFAGAPWQLSHVFGLTATGDEVDGFFGQRGGVLVPRRYRILDIPEPQRTTP